jgi:hypothetical protein
VGGRQAYLAALEREYAPRIKRLRTKLRRARALERARIQAEIDDLVRAWQEARGSAEKGLF